MRAERGRDGDDRAAVAIEAGHAERIEGPTPHGGAAVLALWRDARGNPTTKALAVAAEVHELDDGGDSIFRTDARFPAREREGER